MCELILVGCLCSSLGKMLRGKGHDPFFYQFLLVCCWFGGEFAGIFAGLALGGGYRPGQPETAGLAIVGAVCGAGSGAALVFFLASSLTPKHRPGRSGSSGKLILPPSFQDPPPAPHSAPPAQPRYAYAVGSQPLRFHCPQGHLLEDSYEAAGQQRRCPFCESQFFVPALAVPVAVHAEPVQVAPVPAAVAAAPNSPKDKPKPPPLPKSLGPRFSSGRSRASQN